ncbi:hypothetical protein Godav_028176 [Gossypium davidsonii]|uniref:DUF4283 domain-containing protein n=1 Tax=Gossypium davidsonii TaxID=34287 RepID=A0A7J8S014_GOSDV|nr:hypothetical protein [Gossypium davidsonii]
MAWIRLQGLPSYLYNKKILEEIGDLIGKVAKLDFNTDNQLRGYFARLVIFVNLDKPLISQIMINDRLQKIEYESLPSICFSCERYGHVKELCSFLNGDKKEIGGNEGLKEAKSTAKSLLVDSAKCSPWMKGNGNDRLDNEEVGVGNVGRESLSSYWKGKIEVGAKAILIRVQLALGQGLNLVKAIGNRLFTASIKTVTMEQGIEKNLNNCKERPINVGDFHLNDMSHFNPTFKGLIELEISLNSNMLDPSKYTIVVFKDNLGDNTTTLLEGGDLGIFNIEGSNTIMRASNGKRTATRKGRVFNKIIKDHGEHFKAVKNTKVLLSDSMNSMVALSNS